MMQHGAFSAQQEEGKMAIVTFASLPAPWTYHRHLIVPALSRVLSQISYQDDSGDQTVGREEAVVGGAVEVPADFSSPNAEGTSG